MSDPDPEAEALAFYQTVSSYEHHFNSIEFEVRKLASAWLIAAFAGIAFVVRGDLADNSLLTSWALLLLIAGLAQVGLFSLWILDQVVYHGLLDAVFTNALHIERQFPQVPPTRSMMLRISGGTGMARYLSLFYLLPMLIFAAVAGYAAFRLGGAVVPRFGVAAMIASVPAWVMVKARLQARQSREQRPPPEPSGEAAHDFVIGAGRSPWCAATKNSEPGRGAITVRLKRLRLPRLSPG